ncbi:hypothetical protein BV25DRAFT_1920530 [Artomyces pyxidatus]|uniref:Uncharacterized protein n=1 Tax=Artomyces pyxidatus TaxID=48021 RepID=A0ACB8SL41_9AGAM|nr:hypothetical protein BV25DRAFT_1920530 [Artomyces pyxidatus]
MVNWQDPALLLKDYRTCLFYGSRYLRVLHPGIVAVAVIKLDHVLGGIYMWEIVTSLDYEWSIVAGKRPYGWTLWVYLLCRWSALIAWAILFGGLDSSAPINCEAWNSSFYSFAFISLGSASFLIVLRIYAIWDKSLPIMVIAVAVWLASVALNIRGIAVGRSVYNPTTASCLNLDTNSSFANAVGILASDVILLLLMLAGLIRARTARKFGLWKLLFHQGVAWLSIAAIAEVPTVVFVALNLNDAWNLMFQPVELLILVVGATRMYRSLTDYGAVDEFSSSLSNGKGLSFSVSSEGSVGIPLEVRTRRHADRKYDHAGYGDV